MNSFLKLEIRNKILKMAFVKTHALEKNFKIIKSLVVVFLSLLTVCCGDQKSKDTNQATMASGDTLSSKSQQVPDTSDSRTNGRDSVAHSFLKDCKKWNDFYFGGLQGTGRRLGDSTKNLGFSACYDCRETYEIIFVYREGVDKRTLIGTDSVSKLFFNGCKSGNLFVNFNCFAFIVNLKNPQKMEDEHATRYTFPARVKVWTRVTADNWKFLKELDVRSIQEYRNLQFSTIYGINSK